MHSKEKEAQVLRLYYGERWKIGTIAEELGIHHTVVRRIIAQEGHAGSLPRKKRLIDPYLPTIEETLQKHPRLTASRLYEMVRMRGYPGKISQLRAIVAELRPRRTPEAFLRLQTLPGVQAQVDWAHFAHLEVGSARRPLMAFVMVLSYSRAIYLKFFHSHGMSSFLTGHDEAFRFFGGVPRTCLYDNLKSVVIERSGNDIRFNQDFIAFAGAYRFEARPVGVRRGNEKGRVERAIRYIRENFFAAREFKDIRDLNDQALLWCTTNAMERRWSEDTKRSVSEVFLEEKDKLLPLPDADFPCEEREDVSVGKTPYVRFDLNDYSVPPSYVQSTVTVIATPTVVTIISGTDIIATHQRCYDRRQQIENREHIEALRATKGAAMPASITQYLKKELPDSEAIFNYAVETNTSLAATASALMKLLKSYGRDALESAIQEALSNDCRHHQGVRHILERRREEQGKAPILPLPLDENSASLPPVIPHRLSTYDALIEEKNHDEE
jgi:transposase